MSENVFQYDDMFFLQKIGTAMGTNVAPPYAELYYAYHEFKVLFPKYPEIQLLTRFIDDGFVAWYNKNNPLNHNWKTDERFNSFVADLPFNTLTFTNTLPADKQIFMDLEITLTRGVVSSRTYEKPLALHQYIPPSSEHSPATRKGLIYGMLIRYWNHNSDPADYRHFVGKFFNRIVASGHHPEYLKQKFLAAGKHIVAREKRLVSDQKSTPGIDPTMDDTEDTSRPLYFKWPYHSRGVQARDLQILFDKYLKGHVGFDKMTVALQRPKNLRDFCMSNRVVQEEGKKAS